ncbi:hypothetical protein D3C87_1645230 [compost metagenome]
MPVVLDKGPATTGGLHDGLGACFNRRPPGIDVVPGAIQSGRLGVEVIIHGPATTGAADRRDTDAQPVEHPRGSDVGVG